MPKTLLAVDDSATMRKVLEITFGGDDFTVVTADTPQSAMAKIGDKPAAVVIDTVLGSEDGYALCREIRKKDPNTAIVLLASRYSPYDAGKGKDAGADDFIDKPFDTQQMIDKVRKAVLTRESGAGASAAAAPAAAAPAARPAAPNFPAAGAAAAKPAEKAAPARSQTLVFGEEAKHAPVSAKAPPVDAPKPTPAAPPTAPGLGAAVNGHLAAKLGDLGLSQSQTDAVLALSRDVVERVVWEVVPQLAEALIKEEIARLMRG